MRLSALLRVLAAASVVAAAVACGPRESPDAAYLRKVAEERQRKDDFFRSGSDSPVKPADQAAFLPLTYFDIDPDYAPPAKLTLLEERTRLTMPTSTGKLREMDRVGYLEFTLKGTPQKLTAFADAGTGQVSRLFVPFSDLTSGTETYQAGRYMDIDPQSSGVYVVDFNLAYHPYCYYNAEYDCPFPPAENRLKTPVRAGERLRAAETLAPTR
ncbi:MAG: DUF1684 domain-containing protein [Vicinamibacterales bacterium]